jgi:hypothetical protein
MSLAGATRAAVKRTPQQVARLAKSNGRKGERLTAEYLKAGGFPLAERRRLKGSKDVGDVGVGLPGVVIEVKWYGKTVTAGQLDEFLEETLVEMGNDQADMGVLVVNRPRSQDVGTWHVYVRWSGTPEGQWIYTNGVGLLRILKERVVL